MDSLKNRTGVTLIELLIAVVVLAVAMLGTAAAFVVVERQNSEAFHRAQAVAMARNMLEQVRLIYLSLNPAVGTLYADTGVPAASSVNTQFFSCNAAGAAAPNDGVLCGGAAEWNCTHPDATVGGLCNTGCAPAVGVGGRNTNMACLFKYFDPGAPGGGAVFALPSPLNAFVGGAAIPGFDPNPADQDFTRYVVQWDMVFVAETVGGSVIPAPAGLARQARIRVSWLPGGGAVGGYMHEVAQTILGY